MTTYDEGQQQGAGPASGVPSYPAPDPGSRVSGPPAPGGAPAPSSAEPGPDSPWAPPRDTTSVPAVPPPTSSDDLAAPAPTGFEPPFPGPTLDTPLADEFGVPLHADEPEPVAPATARRGGGSGRVVALAVVAGLLAGVVGGIGAFLVSERIDAARLTSPGTVLPQAGGDLSSRPEGSIAQVAAKVLPTVVQIEERDGAGGGTGSGFVLRSDGYILTNNHVVADAATGGSLSVTFQDGTTLDAKIVGRDTSYDLAVIKVDASGLTASSLGNSSNVVVGDTAIAIGSPLGLEGTVTSGIISSVNRPVTAGGSGESSFINAIQTDAAINPGNSGGPLVNAVGEVIGVNSAIASLGQSAGGEQSGSIGLGFAIPINQAKRVAEEIISTGRSSHPVIGVSVDLTFNGPGAQVKAVTAGGPSDDAGIKVGDVITKVDGRTVDDATEMIVAIRANAPGDTVTLTVTNGSGTRDVEVTLAGDTRTG
jgi:putative serine protease PepD